MTEDRKLGAILVQKGWLGQDQLDTALRVQETDGRILGEILVENGFVSKRDLYRGLAIQYDMPYVDLHEIQAAPNALKLVPKRIAFAHLCLPLFTREGYFLVAISDPRDAWVEGELSQFIHGFKIRTGIATPEDIHEALVKYYGPEGV